MIHDLGFRQPQPFHIVIVRAIEFASEEGLYTMAEILLNTIIPSNHDAIIAAWQTRCQDMGADDCGVTEELLRQKQELAEKQENMK